MRIDENLKYCENQPITAAAASTNYVNLGAAREIGAGEPLMAVVLVTEAFNNATDLTIALQQATDSAFTTPKTIESVKPALADLTLGAIFRLPIPPGVGLQYQRLYFTPSGTAPSTGKLTAFVVPQSEAPRNAAV